MKQPGLYESEELHKVTGPAIRPGGLSLTRRALAFCKFEPGSALLDLGCGQGATLDLLKTEAGLNSVGLDESWSLLEKAAARLPLPALVRGRIESLPFRQASQDGVFCECVLSLQENPARALSEAARVLKTNGRLIITDVYSRETPEASLMADMPIRCCLKGALAQETWSGLVRDAGFGILLWEDHSFFLKELAAKLVFAYGSLAGFWESHCSGAAGDGIRMAVQGRPGYFLLIARKEEKNYG